MSNYKKLEEITKKTPMLIVDDETALSEILAEGLESLGIKSVVFSSPLQIIDYVNNRKEDIHLIITDYHMPHLTGLEMMKKVHQTARISYVLMSGQLQKITDRYCESEIARLSKPFSIDELSELIINFYLNADKSDIRA